MKKVFYYCVVFFTFAVCMMSCSETMGLYEDEGFDMKAAQRQFPVDYDQLANDLDSLGLLYGRDVIVYGVPDIEYQSVLRQTANVMRRIGEKEKNNTFVLITSDGIEKDSITEIRRSIPGGYENISPGSHTFRKSLNPILPEDAIVSWSNEGVGVSMTGYTVNNRNITMEVNATNVSLSGHFSIVYETDSILFPVPTPGIVPNPSNTIAYGFSGVSGEEDTWEIHSYAGPNP